VGTYYANRIQQYQLRAGGYLCRLSESCSPSARCPPAAAPLQGNFDALVQLKQLHPNLKVLVSLGGYSPTNLWNTNFATASSTAAGRTSFVRSCINMFLKGNISSGVSTGIVRWL
jgi:chitinase